MLQAQEPIGNNVAIGASNKVQNTEFPTVLHATSVGCPITPRFR
jgi:hypothetical protein